MATELQEKHSEWLMNLRIQCGHHGRQLLSIPSNFHWAIAERLAEIEAAPIDILLFCPRCGEQHVDQPQPEKNWTNPPHRTHECQSCSYLWRPSDRATNGVASISTGSVLDVKPQHLVWTTHLPTEPGIYWFRFDGKDIPPEICAPQIAEIVRRTDGELNITFAAEPFDTHRLVANPNADIYKHWYAGPLIPPPTPEQKK